VVEPLYRRGSADLTHPVPPSDFPYPEGRFFFFPALLISYFEEILQPKGGIRMNFS
jgi:hypothetical protein